MGRPSQLVGIQPVVATSQIPAQWCVEQLMCCLILKLASRVDLRMMAATAASTLANLRGKMAGMAQCLCMMITVTKATPDAPGLLT